MNAGSRRGYFERADLYQCSPEQARRPDRTERHTQSSDKYLSAGAPDNPRQRQLHQRSVNYHSGQSHCDEISRAYDLLKQNPQRALSKAENLLTKYRENSSGFIRLVQLKSRALYLLGDANKCIEYIDSLPASLQNDKGMRLTKGRALGNRGDFAEARSILQDLYQNQSGSFHGKKTHGLALARLLQKKKGSSNLEEARGIYTNLRTIAGGRDSKPCNDKEIELGLARHLEVMGGRKNLSDALAILTHLRARAARQGNTACDDKAIEMALARHHEIIGGEDNLRKALAIFTQLRARAARHKNRPCDDREIEMGLASIYVSLEMWPEYDALQLTKLRFSGFEIDLHLSHRYHRELLKVRKISSVHSELLGKAIHHAAMAVEKSGGSNSSCNIQLAHCFRLLSLWPQDLLKKLGIEQRGSQEEFRETADFLFRISGQYREFDWRHLTPVALQIKDSAMEPGYGN